ncbi:MAG: TIGR03617 family F420-dependent LLM class oxidoreductase [Halobacteria archaeon]
MKFDVGIQPSPITKAADSAAAAERSGASGIWVGETTHDPMFCAVLMAQATSKVQVGTGVLIAFPRSPMVTALQSWDLQQLSQGRFVLGLGTQVKGHIERRYSTPWHPPAARMKEYVESLYAIWECWQNRKPLKYEGKYYKFSLMTPFFNPGPTKFGRPKVWLAALNARMCRLAGEVADGANIHPFHTRKYLAEKAIPAVKEGLKASGRPDGACEIATAAFVAAGDTEREIKSMKEMVRAQISFYGSTKSYFAVWEAHGWESVGEKLREMSLNNQWASMPKAVPDEALETFTVSGSWDEIPGKLKQKYGGLVDRLALYFPFQPGKQDALMKRVAEGIA